MYVEYFKKRTVGWKVVTGAYFKVHSYFARVSDFQLQSNFLMAVSSALVSRRPTLKRGSGETVYKKFGAAGMLEAPIRLLHFKLIM